MSLDRPGFAHSWQDGELAAWNAEAGDFRPVTAAVAVTQGFADLEVLDLPLLADAPAAPTAGVRIFCVDAGAGTGILKAIFATGAAQTVATEP